MSSDLTRSITLWLSVIFLFFCFLFQLTCLIIYFQNRHAQLIHRRFKITSIILVCSLNVPLCQSLGNLVSFYMHWTHFWNHFISLWQITFADLALICLCVRSWHFCEYILFAMASKDHSWMNVISERFNENDNELGENEINHKIRHNCNIRP